ncbi:MAG: LysM peptidoglycan-binding domain-containing protein [Algoriphagus sp.]|nr:LysM peptidoglycan-binding domain-containing protein [Algoriphagus sp.]
MILRPKIAFLSLLLFLAALPKLEASVPIPGDSIGVERVGDKMFILHKVSPQETLFGISRKYQVSVSDIQNANEVLKQGLKIGQTIRIPYEGKITSTPPASNPVNSAPVASTPVATTPKSITHKVTSGETLFSISKKYGVTIESLKEWNKLSGNGVKVGQVLTINEAGSTQTQVASATKPSEPVTVREQPKVEEKKVEAPKAKSETVKSKPEPVKAASSPVATSAPIAPGDWISHTVKSGETLFSLSSEYGSSVENLIQWNALTSNNLRAGQVIKVGRAPEGPSTVPIVGTPKVASSTAEMNVEPTPENTSGGFKNIKETGQAELIEGTGGHKKYLVLHRTAPVGSVIRVKNEENDLTIFARVVGTLPDTGDNSKLVIKLSQAAFDQLKAVNQRFPVEILY